MKHSKLNIESNSHKILHAQKNVQKNAKSVKINFCLKLCRIISWHELLSASTVFAMCHDSSVFLVRCFPLSMIVKLFNVSLFLAGHKKEKQKALSPAAVLENLRHTLVDYQNRCSNASVEVSIKLIKLHTLSYSVFKPLHSKFWKIVATL